MIINPNFAPPLLHLGIDLFYVAPLLHPTLEGSGGADWSSTCSTFAPPQSTKVEHFFAEGFLPGHGFNITNLKECTS
jgi:hypothetical protein